MIITGDALHELKKLHPHSINGCITSPPYFKQRNYEASDQIGWESSQDNYVECPVSIFRELRLVLRPEGVFWLNLGDSYEDKEMLGVPWSVAFALQRDGWYLRQALPWIKRNPFAEPAKDRPTTAIEYVFMLTKTKKNYFDMDVIRVPHVDDWDSRKSTWVGGKAKQQQEPTYHKPGAKRPFENPANPLGRSFRSNDLFFRSWQGLYEEDGNPLALVVNSSGGKYSHAASFPEKLVEPLLLSSIPVGGIVIDPFSGSGTVGVVAKKNNRKYILIDINQKYCDEAKDRISKV
jgi:DNA modification methylase